MIDSKMFKCVNFSIQFRKYQKNKSMNICFRVIQCLWVIIKMNSRLLSVEEFEESHSQYDSPNQRRRKLHRETVTFRQCIQQVGRDGKYQHTYFVLITIFWISASLFLSLSFYFFQKPHYKFSQTEKCLQYDQVCIKKVCDTFYPDSISQHVDYDSSLTNQFQLYCPYQNLRVFYKSASTTLAFIGFLLYGYMADTKGRKIAMKISWRFYTIGAVVFCCTQTQVLMIFGFFIASINCLPALILQLILMFQTTSNQRRLKSFLIILSSGFMGSLISALFAEYLLKTLGVRLTIFVTCTLPALILCFFLDYIEQSPKFLYKDDKVKAFNAVNRIARKNGKEIILIDLSKSEWIKLENYNIKFSQIFKLKDLKMDILLLFIFLLYTTFNSKSAQVTLDFYTDSHVRGFLMNGATAVAYFTLILTRLKLKIGYLFLCNLGLNLFYFILINLIEESGEVMVKVLEVVAIINLVLLRYTSEMIYGILLIISIEYCPTVIRGQTLGIILTSISVAEAMVRLIEQSKYFYCFMNLAGVIIVLFVEAKGLLKLQKAKKMTDTVKGFYYDELDRYARITREDYQRSN